MIKVAAALNSFASLEATAPPSEEIFVLSANQLEAIIAQAIERATAPLAARLDALERGVRCWEGGEVPIHLSESHIAHDLILKVIQHLQEENNGLKRELEALQDHVAQERAFDRQRITKLETPKTTAKAKTRAEKIKRYLETRPDHKASFENLKGHLGVKNDLLGDAIQALQAAYPDTFAVVKPRTGDKRKRILTTIPRC
jgi:hypothetical protein